ncbi:hypothetical protein JAAARDRAFT_296512 [Jaapia argillacea MUCL 33604]|uniref:Secreted protein n=1 Tax=Jaapia argillacea MUCL 33604 TaxID=933084 RepID=A0A067PPC7_9AGAM|nr:hypothetical protein JAAARDRAFT_296512 [Jaapia argillacea MUCL 33604]
MPSITMIPTFMILSLVFLLLNLITTVHAGLYVVTPSDGSTCHGGQPCTVTWLDDGELPLLTSIGACTVGLYTKDEQLLQQIEPVDVASTHSLTFTPNPEAGPNSGE